MHHFKRLFRKRPKVSQRDAALADVFTPSTLMPSVRIPSASMPSVADFRDAEDGHFPTEILELIISNVRSRTDLVSISLGSKSLNRIIEPLLYRKIDTSFMNADQIGSLYETLQVSSRALVVTDLQIHIEYWVVCSKWNNKLPRRWPACDCNTHDKELGLALQSLRCLQNLVLFCGLCFDMRKERHNYMKDLDLPSLKSFLYTCLCSARRWGGFEIILPLSTVTTLALDWLHIQDEDDGPGADILVDPNVLPNVSGLMHNGTALADSIMFCRPISRVCYFRPDIQDTNQFLRTVHAVFSRSLIPLTHLYVSNILEGLRHCLRASPRPYRHLTGIGTLMFTSYEYSEVLKSLRILGALAQLEMIEVEQDMLSKPSKAVSVCSEPEFRSTLGEQNPNLRVILISVRGTEGGNRRVGTEVWKRGEWEWAHYTIPYYTYWEVLKGAYDDLI